MAFLQTITTCTEQTGYLGLSKFVNYKAATTFECFEFYFDKIALLRRIKIKFAFP